jgi:hypothetical protein
MKQSKLSRRNFLLAAGAGSAAAAAAVAAKALPQAQPAAPVDDKRKTRGYHVSAHINNYYRTAKV